MGTHMRVLSESYSMKTNMAGAMWFSTTVMSCTLEEDSLCFERDNEDI